jgi:hypothetical protein
MKKLIILIAFVSLNMSSFSQSAEAQQLLLNWEKLTQMKKILQQLYDGYKILHTGYTAIKDISEGNFSIHRTFLDGLLKVSPAVRSYKRVVDIISYQLRIAKEYRSAFNQFRESGQFTPEEIDHLSKTYNRLFKASLQNVEDLAMVITAGRLRMSDDERLQAIDRIYDSVVDQYSFLQEFNNQTAVLSIQREKEQMDIDLMRKVHGLQ